jgi:hypothetical protein
VKRFSILKLLSLILVLSINLAGFLPLHNSRAYFSDVEHSPGNAFIADPLHFSLDAGNFSPLEYEDQGSGMAATVSSQSSRDFNLSFFTKNPVGDLCQDIELEAVSGSNDSGRQRLQLFNYPAGSFAAVGGIWYFSANLRNGATDWQGKSCSFDLVFYGEQIGGGYSYQQTVSTAVFAGTLPEKEISTAAEQSGTKTNTATVSAQGASLIIPSSGGFDPANSPTTTYDGVANGATEVGSSSDAADQNVPLNGATIDTQAGTPTPSNDPAPQEITIEASATNQPEPALAEPAPAAAEISPAIN